MERAHRLCRAAFLSTDHFLPGIVHAVNGGGVLFAPPIVADDSGFIRVTARQNDRMTGSGIKRKMPVACVNEVRAARHQVPKPADIIFARRCRQKQIGQTTQIIRAKLIYGNDNGQVRATVFPNNAGEVAILCLGTRG